MKFDFVYLGQTVLKYSVPLEIFVTLKDLYEKRKKEFHDGSFDDEDVNTHQADSYILRLQHQKATLTPGSSQPEVFNVLGQLETLDRVRKSGELLNGTKRERLTKK